MKRFSLMGKPKKAEAESDESGSASPPRERASLQGTAPGGKRASVLQTAKQRFSSLGRKSSLRGSVAAASSSSEPTIDCVVYGDVLRNSILELDDGKQFHKKSCRLYERAIAWSEGENWAPTLSSVVETKDIIDVKGPWEASPDSPRVFGFTDKGTSKAFLFRAGTVEEAEQWCSSIQSCLNSVSVQEVQGKDRAQSSTPLPPPEANGIQGKEEKKEEKNEETKDRSSVVSRVSEGNEEEDDDDDDDDEEEIDTVAQRKEVEDLAASEGMKPLEIQQKTTQELAASVVSSVTKRISGLQQQMVDLPPDSDQIRKVAADLNVAEKRRTSIQDIAEDLEEEDDAEVVVQRRRSVELVSKQAAQKAEELQNTLNLLLTGETRLSETPSGSQAAKDLTKQIEVAEQEHQKAQEILQTIVTDEDPPAEKTADADKTTSEKAAEPEKKVEKTVEQEAKAGDKSSESDESSEYEEVDLVAQRKQLEQYAVDMGISKTEAESKEQQALATLVRRQSAAQITDLSKQLATLPANSPAVKEVAQKIEEVQERQEQAEWILEQHQEAQETLQQMAKEVGATTDGIDVKDLKSQPSLASVVSRKSLVEMEELQKTLAAIPMEEKEKRGMVASKIQLFEDRKNYADSILLVSGKSAAEAANNRKKPPTSEKSKFLDDIMGSDTAAGAAATTTTTTARSPGAAQTDSEESGSEEGEESEEEGELDESPVKEGREPEAERSPVVTSDSPTKDPLEVQRAGLSVEERGDFFQRLWVDEVTGASPSMVMPATPTPSMCSMSPTKLRKKFFHVLFEEEVKGNTPFQEGNHFGDWNESPTLKRGQTTRTAHRLSVARWLAEGSENEGCCSAGCRHLVIRCMAWLRRVETGR